MIELPYISQSHSFLNLGSLLYRLWVNSKEGSLHIIIVNSIIAMWKPNSVKQLQKLVNFRLIFPTFYHLCIVKECKLVLSLVKYKQN
jgi:hypothetical protein